MLKLTLVLAPLLALPLLRQDDAPQDDRKAVERAVQDYVEAFYEAKPELIERSVHADLVKYGFYLPEEGNAYQGTAMTYLEAMSLAERWNAGGKQGDDLTYEIELLDVSDQTAAAKLTAKWGIDYMHLAKFDGRWKIRHVMWQTPPRAGGR